MPYFNKLPIINYSNTKVVDLTRRVAVRDSVQVDPYAYYNYQIREGMRPDQIAEFYYGDPTFDWLVYLSSNIIDPYYGWPLDNESFVEYINGKYGSVVAAQQKIVFWSVNWPSQQGIDFAINQSGYNALPDASRKYYDAVYGADPTQVIRYVRRKEDWVVTTNAVECFFVANGVTFQEGEGVSLRFQANNFESGNGVVTFANNSQVIAQHIFGNLQPNAVTYLYGTNSGSNSAVSGVTNLANNIPIGEQAFWGPTYAYDYEVDVNEQRKNIQLIDRKYKTQIDTEATQDLKGSGPV